MSRKLSSLVDCFQNSDFAAYGYCSNNFNNLVTSFVTLFELMTVNQWHILAEGHVLVTITPNAILS